MKIGFIGCGNIAQAAIASLTKEGVVVASDIIASDVDGTKRATAKRRYGIATAADNATVFKDANTVFLAVKPQHVNSLLTEISPFATGKHLVVSIAAGKKISLVESALPHARVVRIMPNMPCLVAAGMTVFTLGSKATDKDRKTMRKLLGALGDVMELPEKTFDVVTALSGSGPGFFAYFLDHMVHGAMELGLSRADALRLANLTMQGTGKLLFDRKIDPKALVEQVATAKGTTAAGVSVLQKAGTAKVLRQTIRAAAKRSEELSGI